MSLFRRVPTVDPPPPGLLSEADLTRLRRYLRIYAVQGKYGLGMPDAEALLCRFEFVQHRLRGELEGRR